MNRTTIQKFGTFGCVILSILKVLIIIAIVGVLCGGVSLLTLPNHFFTVQTNTDTNIEISLKKLFGNAWEDYSVHVDNFVQGNFDFEKTEDGLEASVESGTSISNRQLGLVLLPLALCLGLLFTIFLFARRFTRALRDNVTPFVPEAEKNLRIAGILTIIYGAVPSFILFPFQELSYLSDDTISSLNLHLDFDMTTICIGIGLIGLSFVFAWGRSLQERLTQVPPVQPFGGYNGFAAQQNPITPSTPNQSQIPQQDAPVQQQNTPAPDAPKTPDDQNFHPDAL